MPQKDIELILLKQFSYYMAFPIFIADAKGNLIFCNEPMEKILGFKFSETGEIPANEWDTIYIPQDANGIPIEKNKLPATDSNDQYGMTYHQLYVKNIKNEIKHV